MPRQQIIAMQQESWKTETNKHKHQPKIFLWLQAWTFQRIRTGNYSVCVLEEKNWSSITCETIKYKTRELAKSHNITQHYFMQRNGFFLHRRTLLCQEFPAGFKEKLIAFQWHVSRLWKRTVTFWIKEEMLMKHHCILIYCPSILLMWLGQNVWWLKTLSYEEMHVTVTLAVLADGSKLWRDACNSHVGGISRW